MTTINKITLSPGGTATDGTPILVAATSNPGTPIHQTLNNTSTLDEVWLYAFNTSNSSVLLTIQYGGNATQNLISQTIPAQSGLYQVIPGLLLNSNDVIKAYAATANVIAVAGFVNRMS